VSTNTPKKREKENYNTEAQGLFDDASREVDDATM
jgi:hypothetical protein